jgi:hypothetical protein
MVMACRTEDVAQPQLRRPLETLPAGASVLFLTSDLQNTWQRLEAHDVANILSQMGPASELLRNPEILRLQRSLQKLEEHSGKAAKDDLLLNALGGRAGIALYNSEEGGTRADILLVSELRDPARFRAALDTLRSVAGPDLPRFSDATLDGKPGLRLEPEDGKSLLLVQDGSLLVLSSRDDLVRQTLAVQAGSSQASAMRDPDFMAGLQAVGPQNLLILSHGKAAGGARWMAQGLTWDRTGLHFEHRMQFASNPAAKSEATHRQEILRSIPDGMTLAGYAHTSDLDLHRLLHDARVGAGDATVNGCVVAAVAAADDSQPPSAPQRHRAGPPQLPFPPFALGDMMPWLGDEVGVALLDVQATTLAPVPNLAFIVSVRDRAQAEQGLRALEESASVVTIGGHRHAFADVAYGGRTYRSLSEPLIAAVTPSYLLDGDVAILTTTRELMQQIIDTRRVGKHHLLTDASFQRFKSFVPADASMVLYTDQRRLHRAAQQLGQSASMWGPDVARGVETVERLSGLLEHFPASAAFVTRTPDQLSVRGWMLESD